MQEGEKAGVLGINGTGKSTLLKMIAGLDEPDKGEIIKANHVVIRYLPQHPVFEEEETVLESVVRGNRTKENQWTIEADAKAMLTKLGIMKPEFLKKNKGIIIVLIFVAAAIITPPDVISQIMLGIPMVLLLEISTKICVIVDKTNKRQTV